MYVPSDSFGGVSPERKAAESLRTFFTFVAVKIILAQLEGSGRGSLASYNAEAYTKLSAYVQANKMQNGDEWLGGLMQEDELLAVRVMEVRAAYAADDFEWDQCRRLVGEATKAANVAIMRRYASARFERSLREPSDPDAPPDM